MQQLAEFGQRTVRGQDRQAFVDHSAHTRQVVLDRGHVRDLVSFDTAGAARDAREEHHQAAIEFLQALPRGRDALDMDPVGSRELHVIESAIGCEDLVLVADRLAQDIPFQVDRQARQFGRADVAPQVPVQSLQQADREGRGTAQTGKRRQVSRDTDLDVALDTAQPQRLAHRRVLDLLERADAFDLAIGDPDVVIEQFGRKTRDR